MIITTRRLLATALLIGSGTGLVKAQDNPGDLWPSFADNGIYTRDFGFNDNLNDVAFDWNSQTIFATGVALSPSFLGELKVLALNRYTGQPVASFADNGVFTYTSPNESYGYAVIPDGDKLLVGGISISLSTGYADILMLRLNVADGTLDNTFGTNGVVNLSLTDYDDFLQAMAIQPDGKIVVSGTMGIIDGFDLENTPVVLRFNADGSLDTGFGTNGMTSFAADAIDNELTNCKVITDGAHAGKILVAGHWQNTFTGATDFDMLAIRLNADGSPDANFSFDGMTTISINGGIDDCFGMDRDNLGNIYLGGFTTVPTTLELDMTLVKLDDSGNLVSGFGNGGIVTYHEQAYNVANDIVRDDFSGFIGVAGAIGGGFLDPTSMALWQYDQNGNPISGFGTSGVWKFSPVANGVYEFNAIEFIEDGFDNFYASVGKGYTGTNNDMIVSLNWLEHTESVLETEATRLTVYPNPTENVISIPREQLLLNKPTEYRVMSSLGQECLSGSLASGEHTIVVDRLVPGLYTLMIDSDGSAYRGRFVVR